MFRDAGNLVLMEHSCLCCLIICANNFQNSFDVFSIDISTCMSLVQLFLFYILDTLKRAHFDFGYAVKGITSDSGKITFVAKRQIEVSSTSIEVSFIQQNLSN